MWPCVNNHLYLSKIQVPFDVSLQAALHLATFAGLLISSGRDVVSIGLWLTLQAPLNIIDLRQWAAFWPKQSMLLLCKVYSQKEASMEMKWLSFWIEVSKNSSEKFWYVHVCTIYQTPCILWSFLQHPNFMARHSKEEWIEGEPGSRQWVHVSVLPDKEHPRQEFR